MIARVLAFLFPPKLPGRIKGWGDEAAPVAEQGWVGPAKQKYKYQNGIERHFAEHPKK